MQINRKEKFVKKKRKTVPFCCIFEIHAWFDSCNWSFLAAIASRSSSENCSKAVKWSTSDNLLRPLRSINSIITNVSTTSQPSSTHNFSAAPNVPVKNRNIFFQDWFNNNEKTDHQ